MKKVFILLCIPFNLLAVTCQEECKKAEETCNKYSLLKPYQPLGYTCQQEFNRCAGKCKPSRIVLKEKADLREKPNPGVENLLKA